MPIKFCPICSNKYYDSVEVDKTDSGVVTRKLMYHCVKCKISVPRAIEDCCVLTVEVRQRDGGSGTSILQTKQSGMVAPSYSHLINQYTIKDPTLPRLNNIPCPNPQCVCNQASGSALATSSEQEKIDETPMPSVVFLRYNHEEMLFVYICEHCQEVWHTPETSLAVV